MLPSANKNSERESNPIPYTLYFYLFGSAFIASFTAPNKQSFRVKPIFKSRDYLSNSQTINKFTTLFGVKGVVSSYFKELPSNLNPSLELFHSIFGGRTLFTV